MASVEDGGRALQRLGQEFHRQSGTAMRKRFFDGIQDAVRPTAEQHIPQSALSTLPRRGGLAAKIARLKVETTAQLQASTIAVRLKPGSGSRQVGQINDGTVRHPVFRRGAWVTQSVRPGFFSRPIEADAPQFRKSIQQVMQDVANDLESSV